MLDVWHNSRSDAQDIVQRVQALAPKFGERAEAAEEAREIPRESVRDLLEAGIARILMPRRFGGLELGFDTWFEVVREISKADASHGWCASVIIHHAHVLGQFPEEAQRAVWNGGPDVAIAASIAPKAQVTRVDGGYRISGQCAFASGVGHSTWVMVGGLVRDAGAPEWTLFLIPPDAYQVRDTWFTTGMQGTGSNTIVTDNVFVPASRTLRMSDLRDGKGAGGAIHQSPIFHAPFFSYAPLAFATPMLGAAQGAYKRFRETTKRRQAADGTALAEKAAIQVPMARAAADLDAAEFLLTRAAEAGQAPGALPASLLARSVRDFARAAELAVGAIDTLVALSGTAGFATSNPIQRAWRDIHFAGMHVSVNAENNYAHYGRLQLGLPRDPSQPFF